MKLSSICQGVVCLILSAVSIPCGYAQYRVHEWTDFEKGQLPESAILIGDDPQSVQVADLSKVPNPPPGFRSPEAASQTGRMGLHLRYPGHDPGVSMTRMAGIIVGDVLDRDTLGANGRALVQADLYLPPGAPVSNLAVLATEPPNPALKPKSLPQVTGRFYRFGLSGAKRNVYFSLVGSMLREADTGFVSVIPVPGWHRVSIVFEGQNNVRCFIDGREPSFSPIMTDELRRVNVGVVLVDNGPKPLEAYVDNLSIQISLDAPVWPSSPYAAGWRVPPGKVAPEAIAAAAQAAVLTPAPSTVLDTRKWLEPGAAWQTAQQVRKPMLLYFYAPGIPGTMKVDGFLSSDPRAAAFLDQHICARIDVNQLQGGAIAEQYAIFKVPTFLVFSPDGKSNVKAIYRPSNSWDDLQKQLALPR